MAKKPAPDRRAIADKMRADQRRAERSRGLAVVGGSALVALVIIGSALWFGSAVPYVSQKYYDTRELDAMSLERGRCSRLGVRQDHDQAGHGAAGARARGHAAHLRGHPAGLR